MKELFPFDSIGGYIQTVMETSAVYTEKNQGIIIIIFIKFVSVFCALMVQKIPV